MSFHNSLSSAVKWDDTVTWFLLGVTSPSPALLHNKHKRPFIIYFFLNDKKNQNTQ